MSDHDDQPAPDRTDRGDGPLGRIKDLGTDARDRVAVLAAWAVDRVFDAPLDIRTGREAEAALLSTDEGHGQQFAQRAAGWGAARAARRVGTRYGSKIAGRAAAPIGAVVEFGLAARSGVRELQVLTSLLVNRLTDAGQDAEAELVRRTVLSLYLEPTARPDLRASLASHTTAVAKRWTLNAVPLTGRRQATLTKRRIAAIERLRLDELVADWRRATAIDVAEARAATPTPPTSPTGGGEVVDLSPAGRVAPPPPPPPPPGAHSAGASAEGGTGFRPPPPPGG